MALLAEHDSYLVAMDQAYAAFRGALVDALGLQDNPQYATLASVKSTQQAYVGARTEFNSFFVGGGSLASGTDSLTGYREPDVHAGPFSLNPAGEVLPKVIPLLT